MPPRCTDPVFRGWKGSETSYCRNSPVPKQEIYRKRSSSERLMSVISGGTALKPCSRGGRLAGSAGSAGNFDYFLDFPFAVIAMPEPDGRGKIFQRHDLAQKTVGARGVVRRTQFQRHLLLRTQIEFLQMAPLRQVPHVHLVAVAAS